MRRRRRRGCQAPMVTAVGPLARTGARASVPAAARRAAQQEATRSGRLRHPGTEAPPLRVEDGAVGFLHLRESLENRTRKSDRPLVGRAARSRWRDPRRSRASSGFSGRPERARFDSPGHRRRRCPGSASRRVSRPEGAPRAPLVRSVATSGRQVEAPLGDDETEATAKPMGRRLVPSLPSNHRRWRRPSSMWVTRSAARRRQRFASKVQLAAAK